MQERSLKGLRTLDSAIFAVRDTKNNFSGGRGLNAFLDRIAVIPPVYDEERAARALSDLQLVISRNPSQEPLGQLLESNERVRDLLLSVFGNSSHLARLAHQNPECLFQCLTGDPVAVLDNLSVSLREETSADAAQKAVMAALRHYKQKIALIIGLCDVAGVWTIDEVIAQLSNAANISISSAVRYLLSQAVKTGKLEKLDITDPEPGSGYFVIGMGKLGAGELNYSSDIDLIVFFDAELAPVKEGTEVAPFFVRMTRDLASLLQERTADGYVWRTDLRLRPDPGATQLALSTDAALSYYESFGQNWERAALIKARVVAGDQKVGNAFLEQLSPFIWRRYLDYAAVADIHAMKRRVHEFKGHARIAVAGHDVKLGRGGIREIEFFTQTQQLIAGGRQEELREKKTLVTLQRLQEQGWIEKEAVAQLSEAYRFLRMVEHRLQMIADEQTHTLPTKDEDIDRVACFCGFENAEAFSQSLIDHLTRVQKFYDALFARLPPIGDKGQEVIVRADDELPETLAALEESGFSDPERVVELIRGWRAGRYAATRSQRARECLAVIQPALLEAFAATADPSSAIASFDRFISELPAGVQLFSLLRSNPSLLRLIADIMGTAPRLARFLSRRSRVLDAVLDPGFFGGLPDSNQIEEMIADELSSAGDYQECLDRARRVGQEQAFLIGVRILSGTVSADQAGDAYAALARSVIRAMHGAVEKELSKQHGTVKGGGAVVVAMGKLGSNEMTASSDLDLIIVYDFDAEAGLSDGQRPLMGGQYYARFTQRLISALSAQTTEGSLYEVDMRLRPSGHSGPVATQFDGFVDYQTNKAWTWEHLALVRARVVAGPEDLAEKVNAAIRDVLTTKRDRKQIAKDVREMRTRIEKEKGTTDIWDIKNVAGGLIDLEFIAQYLQLVMAHEHPGILNQNTSSALQNLAAVGALSEEEAGALIPAAALYHNLTQILRLCLEKPFDREQASPGLMNLLARAGGAPDFPSLEDRLAKTLTQVRNIFDCLIR